MECIIYFSQNLEKNISPVTNIASIPLINRILLSCIRAGVTKFYLLGAPREEITTTIKSDPRINKPWEWIQNTNNISNKNILFYSNEYLVNHKVLSNFLEKSGDTQNILSINKEKIAVAIVEKNLIETYSNSLEQKIFSLPAYETTGFSLKISQPIKKVETRLLNSLQSPLEGTVDVYFNRPLGRLITLPLVKLKANPNLVSIFSILTGIIGSILLVNYEYWITITASLLIQISAIIDCIDGDIARIQFRESTLGKWLDITGDNIVNIMIFISLALREYRLFHNWTPIIFGAMLAGGTIISFLLVIYSKVHLPKISKEGQNSDILANLQNFIDKLTNRDFTVLIIIGAIIGNFTWFLWLAAIGIQFFWLLLLFLVIMAQKKLMCCSKIK